MANNAHIVRTTKELRDASFLLRNLFKTGSLGADQILHEAGNMAPKWRTQFHAASKLITTRGIAFHIAVKSIFGPKELSAIRAGEESGKLYDVFDQLWESAKTQQQINKVMKGLITPVAVMFGAVIISIVFFLTLVPNLVRNLVGTVKDFQPSPPIRAAISSQEWVVANAATASVIAGLLVFVITGLLASRNVRDNISDFVIRTCIKIEVFGVAYSHLKFGFVAKYLEIVSLAGVPADERLVIVLDLIPEPIRNGFEKFKLEVIEKGIKGAAGGEGKPDGDPRKSLVQWPPYFQLALFQSHESGEWSEPMREYGTVLVQDGKDRLEGIIKILTNVSILIAGVLLLIPVSLMYGTMGEILILRMRQL